MIVRMKKIFLVVQKKDAGSALAVLRDAGIVHVDHVKYPSGQEIQQTKEDIQVLEKALDLLPADTGKTVPPAGDDYKGKALRVLELTERISILNEACAKRQMQIAQWEPWGNFDPQDIRVLEERGVFFKLAVIAAKDIPLVPAGVVVRQISRSKGAVRCLLISDKTIQVPFECVDPPAVSLQEMHAMQEEDRHKITEAEKELESYAGCREDFQKVLQKQTALLQYREALSGMGDSDELVYLRGFAPIDRSGELEQVARNNHWGLLVEEPGEEDKVPTLLKNPRWVNMIKPVFQIMNILPGYKEVDISLFFLLFFSVFFGMLIGDAGYGAVFFILTLAAHLKLRNKIKDSAPFFLMYVLSMMTIIWGVLTGVIFGQAWLPKTVHPFFPWLANNEHVQLLCFFIGAVHLSIAHLWRAILKFPMISALCDIGWLSIIWGMFFIAQMLILGKPLPDFVTYLFAFGVGNVLFFSRPNKNVLKALGGGLGDLLLSIINAFTDVVSYIRLFAVGLATVAVADAFNQMALDIGFGSFASGLMTASILVLGHVLNIVLGAMAVLVHGVRLNVLEFSSHLSMEWTGTPYTPLKKVE